MTLSDPPGPTHVSDPPGRQQRSDPPQLPVLSDPSGRAHLSGPPEREPSPGAAVRAGRDEVWPVRVDPSGRSGPTRNQSTGPHWRRTGPGLYVPAATPRTTGQRIIEAAAVLPAYGAVTGWAALRWCGGGWFEGLRSDATTPLDVQLACDHRRPVPGIAICEEGLDPSELTQVDGVRVTTPVRSVCFLMRYAYDLAAAVRALDMAAYNDLVSITEVSEYAGHHNAWTGIPQCREALAHCDENAWSPCEVDMRLIWNREAELPRPLTNVPVFDLHGRHVGTPDLLDPVAGVVGEYDGALHLAGAQRSRDLRREAAFRRAGLQYVTMLAGDLPDHRPVIERMRTAYALATRDAVTDRAWTITHPNWWVPTHTVEQRRALTREQRSRWLALRRTPETTETTETPETTDSP